MRKDVISIIIGVILITTVFCGCTGTEVESDYSSIFKSDVTNLVNYTIEHAKNKAGNIYRVTVNGIIEISVERPLNVLVTTKFYGKNNEYIDEETYTIFGLGPNLAGTRSTTFTTSYEGGDASEIDNVKIYVDEIK